MNTNMYLLYQSMLDSLLAHIMNFLHLDPALINFNQQLPKILVTQASMHQLGLSFNALYNPHFGASIIIISSRMNVSSHIYMLLILHIKSLKLSIFVFSLRHWTKHFLVFKEGRNLDYQLHLANQTQIGQS